MAERFRVDLRGIIDLTANHMYTSPEVFVRELVQNAVDAITVRRQLDRSFDGQVKIELTPGEKGAPATICVIDNGVGLTLDEVHEFLSTVGGSSKRAGAQAKADRISKNEGNILGRFGIGLLSCFMVSDEIVVVSRSARDPGAPAVEWRGKNDGAYSVREFTEPVIPPGTSVYLTCKPEMEEHFEFDHLLGAAKRFAEMLPTRILVCQAGEEVVANAAASPWDMNEADSESVAEYCEQALGFRPLDAFRFRAEAGDVDGMVFIRTAREGTWGGAHKLYCNGMFVTEQGHQVVPEWATFVGVMMNARGLRLVASREAFMQDAALDALREQIGEAVRVRLAHLLRNDRPRFEAIMAVHDVEIRGMAIKDPDFFEIIIDMLDFETTLGRTRFGEFRRENHQLLVARTAEQYRRISAIAPGLGLRVFHGGYTYHEELLAKAAQSFPDISLRSFDTADLVGILDEPPAPDDFAGLLAAASESMESRGCEVVVRDYAPEHLPAFFALGLDAEFHRQLDRTKAAASALWKKVLDIMAPRPEQLSPTRLCLNSRNPIVQRLALAKDTALQQTALDVLYAQSLMGGQFALTAKEMDLLNRGMDALLRRALAGGGRS